MATPKKFYIADTHYFHENVIRFDNRPFETIEEMNKTMLENWNSAVHPRDTVYILGDFIWHRNPETIKFLRKLHGSKILVQGNHDRLFLNGETKKLFSNVSPYREGRDSGYRVVMCHYPIPLHAHHRRENTIHLYGHVHTTQEYRVALNHFNQVKDDPLLEHKAREYNVGCMLPWMDYTPRTLGEIVERAEVHKDWLDKFMFWSGLEYIKAKQSLREERS